MCIRDRIWRVMMNSSRSHLGRFRRMHSGTDLSSVLRNTQRSGGHGSRTRSWTKTDTIQRISTTNFRNDSLFLDLWCYIIEELYSWKLTSTAKRFLCEWVLPVTWAIWDGLCFSTRFNSDNKAAFAIFGLFNLRARDLRRGVRPYVRMNI